MVSTVRIFVEVPHQGRPRLCVSRLGEWVYNDDLHQTHVFDSVDDGLKYLTHRNNRHTHQRNEIYGMLADGREEIEKEMESLV